MNGAALAAASFVPGAGPCMYSEFGVGPGKGDFFAGGMRGGGGCGGGSRGSKAPKKHDEDDDEVYTTVMLRNIPNKYTQAMLVEQLHQASFRGNIDYLYLPIDFANRCNCGYCFINFRTSTARQCFVGAFDGVAVQSCLPGFNSYKVCQVTKAKWQGREENVRRLRSGPDLMAQLAAHPEWLPVLLDESGEQETFPVDVVPRDGQMPVSLPRRSSRKGGPMPVQAGLQAWSGMQDGMADAGFYGGHGGGKGQGKVPRDRRGWRGAAAAAAAGGVPEHAQGGMYGMPMMPDQGCQYMQYGYGGCPAFSPPGSHMPANYSQGGYMAPPYGAYCNNPGWYSQDESYHGGGYDGFDVQDFQQQQQQQQLQMQQARRQFSLQQRQPQEPQQQQRQRHRDLQQGQ